MANRREEKERLRAERLAAQQAQAGSERRRLIIGYIFAGVLTLAVVAGIVAVIASGGGDDGGTAASDCAEAHVQIDSGFNEGLELDCREGTTPPAIAVGDLEASAKEAGCEPMLDLKDEGAKHVPNTTPVTYKTNPPTSGSHNENPAADGAYTTPLGPATGTGMNERNFVHAMEHGRVIIHYNSELPEEEQLAIKGVFDEDPDGMLMTPNDEMPYAVAVTAWTQLVGCPSYSPVVLDLIRNFRDTYRGNGPEKVPISLG